MIYVTSDLHGCAPEVFFSLLERAGFSDEDFLFVLGDVIDRGDHGMELLRWMSVQPNVQLILGNHEAMLLSCRFLLELAGPELTPEQDQLLTTWMCNGAKPTLEGMLHILDNEPECMEGIMDLLQSAPLYDTVEAGGKRYILVHAGLGAFAPDKPLGSYLPEELLWERPTPDTRYYTDAVVVFGHTPTHFFGREYKGKMLQTDSWICIDTGAAMDGTPMLLRLDDQKAFY